MKRLSAAVLAAIVVLVAVALAPAAQQAGVSVWITIPFGGLLAAGGLWWGLRKPAALSQSSAPALADKSKPAAPTKGGSAKRAVLPAVAPSAASQPAVGKASAADAGTPPAAAAAPAKKAAPERPSGPHLEVKSEPQSSGTVMLTIDAFGYNGGRYHDFILRDLRKVPGVTWAARDKQRKFRLRGTVSGDKLQAALDAIAKIK